MCARDVHDDSLTQGCSEISYEADNTAPEGSIASTWATPSAGNCAAIASAWARSHITATVGPDPESHAAQDEVASAASRA